VLEALARLREGRPGLDEDLAVHVHARLDAADAASGRTAEVAT